MPFSRMPDPEQEAAISQIAADTGRQPTSSFRKL
jgi:hypothetical protein